MYGTACIAGLVSISLQKRIREIGIRRVLGASVNSIIYLFLKEFLGLSIISSLVAFPIAWWLLSAWLNAYTYRISLGPGPFLLCIGLLVFVTAVLISSLTYRFSFHNPSRNIQAD
ncbi:FtsX-like permease family protein [Flavihumibacter sp. CACIAM 22H1]|uniref:ABC transporter permease n=1 Tax=Flavihumibacter sp. CACIAM 22H1 TaxID=1812911 RepID=UPI00344B450F